MCCIREKWIFIILLNTISVFVQCQSDQTLLTKSQSSSDCKLVINEINTGSVGTIKNNDFIELKMLCTSEKKINTLQGYKIIGISVGPGSAKKFIATIDLVVNLWNQKMKTNSEFFSIGASNIANVDLTPSSPFFSFQNKYTGNTRTMLSFLNKRDSHLHAIAILYKKGNAFPEIQLSQKKSYLNIESDVKELIKAHLVDMVVYAKKAPFDSCDFFTNLHDEYANKPYVLREFDNSKNDRTLNRCSFDDNAFIPDKIKLGSPTPAMY